MQQKPSDQNIQMVHTKTGQYAHLKEKDKRTSGALMPLRGCTLVLSLGLSLYCWYPLSVLYLVQFSKPTILHLLHEPKRNMGTGVAYSTTRNIEW